MLRGLSQGDWAGVEWCGLVSGGRGSGIKAYLGMETRVLQCSSYRCCILYQFSDVYKFIFLWSRI